MTQKYQINDVVSEWCFKLADLGSEIRRMFLLGQEKMRNDPNLDLIDLSLGNPDLEPPEEVKKALIQILSSPEKGKHRYMDNAGLLETRQFLSRELSRSEGVEISPDSVFLTCGAAGALQIVMRTILSPGDEVIIIAPYFVEYLPYTVDMGNKPVVVESDENHLPRLDKFEAALSPKTKLVIINSPNNPTGVVYSEKVLREMVQILERHREKTGRLVHMISDEPYSRLVFENTKLPSVLKTYDAAWLVRSHSKDLGLAGERIGYIAWGPAFSLPETLGALRNSARAIGFPNAPALMQRVIPYAYHALVNVTEYENRMERFLSILTKGGFQCVKPGGGFFAFPRTPIPDDRAFCQAMVNKGVLCVPGSGFGAPGYFRVSLTQPLPRLEEAAHRLVSWRQG